MTRKEQLDLWVNGDSRHNNGADECCPDFSCCKPNLLVDVETRKQFRDAFVAGRDDVVEGMLMGFLSKAMSSYLAEKEAEGETPLKVHVVGYTYD